MTPDEVRWQIIGLITEIAEVELAQFAAGLHKPVARSTSLPNWTRDYLAAANAYQLSLMLPLLVMLAWPEFARQELWAELVLDAERRGLLSVDDAERKPT